MMETVFFLLSLCPHCSSLSYDKAKTLFRAGHPPTEPVVHRIPLANQFEVPVVIYDVKLPSKAQEYFSVSSD